MVEMASSRKLPDQNFVVARGPSRLELGIKKQSYSSKDSLLEELKAKQAPVHETRRVLGFGVDYAWLRKFDNRLSAGMSSLEWCWQSVRCSSHDWCRCVFHITHGTHGVSIEACRKTFVAGHVSRLL